MRFLCRVGQAGNDVGRRAGLDQQAEPHARGELRIAKLDEGRHVLHRRPAFRAGDAECLEFAGRVLRRRGVDLREAEQRMAGDQPIGLQSRTTIGAVGEIEVELLVEQEAQEMRWRAGLYDE